MYGKKKVRFHFERMRHNTSTTPRDHHSRTSSALRRSNSFVSSSTILQQGKGNNNNNMSRLKRGPKSDNNIDDNEIYDDVMYDETTSYLNQRFEGLADSIILQNKKLEEKMIHMVQDLTKILPQPYDHQNTFQMISQTLDAKFQDLASSVSQICKIQHQDYEKQYHSLEMKYTKLKELQEKQFFQFSAIITSYQSLIFKILHTSHNNSSSSSDLHDEYQQMSELMKNLNTTPSVPLPQSSSHVITTSNPTTSTKKSIVSPGITVPSHRSAFHPPHSQMLIQEEYEER